MELASFNCFAPTVVKPKVPGTQAGVGVLVGVLVEVLVGVCVGELVAVFVGVSVAGAQRSA